MPTIAVSKTYSIRRVLAMAPLLWFSFAGLFLLGCDLSDRADRLQRTLDDGVARFDEAQKALTDQSKDWQLTLKNLLDQLGELEGKANGDVKGAILDVKEQVSVLLSESKTHAQVLASTTIREAGTEFRCNAHFTSDLVSNRLSTLSDNLKFWKAHKRFPDNPPAHVVCGTVGTTLMFDSTNSGLRLQDTGLFAAKTIAVFGYNFRPGALPTLELRSPDQTERFPLNVAVNYVTQFQLTIVLSDSLFVKAKHGSSLRLTWDEGGDYADFSVVIVGKSRLRIESGVLTKAQPTVNDQVSLTVRVKNTGDEKSAGYTVTWTPSESSKQTSAIQPALNAGEFKDITLGPSVYHTAGEKTDTISLSNNDDTTTLKFKVAALPTRAASIVSIRIHDVTANADDASTHANFAVTVTDHRGGTHTVSFQDNKFYHRQGAPSDLPPPTAAAHAYSTLSTPVLLQDIAKIMYSHDNSGNDPGWKATNVEVFGLTDETPPRDVLIAHWTNSRGMWWATDEGDHRTEKEIPLTHAH